MNSSIRALLINHYKSKNQIPLFVRDSSNNNEANKLSLTLKQSFIELKLLQDQQKNLKSLTINKIFEPISGNSQILSQMGVIIKGGPGSGKSTLMDKIAYQWASQYEQHQKTSKQREFKIDYLFKINLRIINQPNVKKSRSISEIIYYSLEEAWSQQLALRSNHANLNVQQQFMSQISEILTVTDRSKIAILLDGFDEITHFCKDNSRQQGRVIDQIFKMIKPDLKISRGYSVIITTRPEAMGTSYLSNFTRVVEIQPLKQRNIEKFMRHCFGGDDGSSSQMMIKNIKQNRRLFKILENPLHLTMVCVLMMEQRRQVINKEKSSINQISEQSLYDQIIRLTAQRNLQKKYFSEKTLNFMKFVSKSYQYKKIKVLRILMKLVYKAFLKGQQVLKAKDMIQNQNEFQEKQLQYISLVINFGLLKETANSSKAKDHNYLQYSYEFTHLSFAQFLLANYLFQQLKQLRNKPESDYQITEFITHRRYINGFFNTFRYLTMLTVQYYNTDVDSEKQMQVMYPFQILWMCFTCNINGLLQFGQQKKLQFFIQMVGLCKGLKRRQKDKQKHFDYAKQFIEPYFSLQQEQQKQRQNESPSRNKQIIIKPCPFLLWYKYLISPNYFPNKLIDTLLNKMGQIINSIKDKKYINEKDQAIVVAFCQISGSMAFSENSNKRIRQTIADIFLDIISFKQRNYSRIRIIALRQSKKIFIFYPPQQLSQKFIQNPTFQKIIFDNFQDQLKIQRLSFNLLKNIGNNYQQYMKKQIAKIAQLLSYSLRLGIQENVLLLELNYFLNKQKNLLIYAQQKGQLQKINEQYLRLYEKSIDDIGSQLYGRVINLHSSRQNIYSSIQMFYRIFQALKAQDQQKIKSLLQKSLQIELLLLQREFPLIPPTIQLDDNKTALSQFNKYDYSKEMDYIFIRYLTADSYKQCIQAIDNLRYSKTGADILYPKKINNLLQQKVQIQPYQKYQKLKQQMLKYFQRQQFLKLLQTMIINRPFIFEILNDYDYLIQGKQSLTIITEFIRRLQQKNKINDGQMQLLIKLINKNVSYMDYQDVKQLLYSLLGETIIVYLLNSLQYSDLKISIIQQFLNIFDWIGNLTPKIYIQRQKEFINFYLSKFSHHFLIKREKYYYLYLQKILDLINAQFYNNLTTQIVSNRLICQKRLIIFISFKIINKIDESLQIQLTQFLQQYFPEYMKAQLQAHPMKGLSDQRHRSYFDRIVNLMDKSHHTIIAKILYDLPLAKDSQCLISLKQNFLNNLNRQDLNQMLSYLQNGFRQNIEQIIQKSRIFLMKLLLEQITNIGHNNLLKIDQLFYIVCNRPTQFKSELIQLLFYQMQLFPYLKRQFTLKFMKTIQEQPIQAKKLEIIYKFLPIIAQILNQFNESQQMTIWNQLQNRPLRYIFEYRIQLIKYISKMALIFPNQRSIYCSKMQQIFFKTKYFQNKFAKQYQIIFIINYFQYFSTQQLKQILQRIINNPQNHTIFDLCFIQLFYNNISQSDVNNIFLHSFRSIKDQSNQAYYQKQFQLIDFLDNKSYIILKLANFYKNRNCRRAITNYMKKYINKQIFQSVYNNITTMTNQKIKSYLQFLNISKEHLSYSQRRQLLNRMQPFDLNNHELLKFIPKVFKVLEQQKKQNVIDQVRRMIEKDTNFIIFGINFFITSLKEISQGKKKQISDLVFKILSNPTYLSQKPAASSLLTQLVKFSSIQSKSQLLHKIDDTIFQYSKARNFFKEIWQVWQGKIYVIQLMNYQIKQLKSKQIIILCLIKSISMDTQSVDQKKAINYYKMTQSLIAFIDKYEIHNDKVPEALGKLYAKISIIFHPNLKIDKSYIDAYPTYKQKFSHFAIAKFIRYIKLQAKQSIILSLCYFPCIFKRQKNIFKKLIEDKQIKTAQLIQYIKIQINKNRSFKQVQGKIPMFVGITILQLCYLASIHRIIAQFVRQIYDQYLNKTYQLIKRQFKQSRLLLQNVRKEEEQLYVQCSNETFKTMVRNKYVKKRKYIQNYMSKTYNEIFNQLHDGNLDRSSYFFRQLSKTLLVACLEDNQLNQNDCKLIKLCVEIGVSISFKCHVDRQQKENSQYFMDGIGYSIILQEKEYKIKDGLNNYFNLIRELFSKKQGKNYAKHTPKVIGNQRLIKAAIDKKQVRQIFLDHLVILRNLLIGEKHYKRQQSKRKQKPRQKSKQKKQSNDKRFSKHQQNENLSRQRIQCIQNKYQKDYLIIDWDKGLIIRLSSIEEGIQSVIYLFVRRNQFGFITVRRYQYEEINHNQKDKQFCKNMKGQNIKQDGLTKVKNEEIDYSGKIQMINSRRKLIEEKNGQYVLFDIESDKIQFKKILLGDSLKKKYRLKVIDIRQKQYKQNTLQLEKIRLFFDKKQQDKDILIFQGIFSRWVLLGSNSLQKQSIQSDIQNIWQILEVTNNTNKASLIKELSRLGNDQQQKKKINNYVSIAYWRLSHIVASYGLIDIGIVGANIQHQYRGEKFKQKVIVQASDFFSFIAGFVDFGPLKTEMFGFLSQMAKASMERKQQNQKTSFLIIFRDTCKNKDELDALILHFAIKMVKIRQKQLLNIKFNINESVKIPLLQNIFLNIDRFKQYFKDLVIEAEIKTQRQQDLSKAMAAYDIATLAIAIMRANIQMIEQIQQQNKEVKERVVEKLLEYFISQIKIQSESKVEQSSEGLCSKIKQFCLKLKQYFDCFTIREKSQNQSEATVKIDEKRKGKQKKQKDKINEKFPSEQTLPIDSHRPMNKK